MGSGSGIPLGDFYLGPLNERRAMLATTSIAYTRKDFSGFWTFYPDDQDAEEHA
jgi:hypothetical protein